MVRHLDRAGLLIRQRVCNQIQDQVEVLADLAPGTHCRPKDPPVDPEGFELTLERRDVVARHVRVQLSRLFLVVRRHLLLPAVDHRARGAVCVGAVPLPVQQCLEVHQVW